MPASPGKRQDWILWARRNIDSVLVVFDLDGTLVDERLRTRKSDLEAVAELRRRGARVTLATGRTYNSAQAYVSRFEIDVPIILCNGAIIMDTPRQSVLYERRIPADLAMVVLKQSKRLRLEPLIYTDGVNGHPCVGYLTPALRDFLLLEGLHRAEIDVLEQRVKRDPPVKIQVIGETRTLRLLQEAVLASDPELPIVMSQDDYLEIAPPGASKGQALRKLCRMINVPLAHTLAFGDGRNDEQMLVLAGFGVAMANAPEELRRTADLSTSSVASALKLLLLT